MRKSGILLHIASLPNDYGIGSMGREAYDFVDYLKNPVRAYGRYCRFPRPATAIPRTRASQYTPGTLISSALTCLPRKVC